MQQEKDSTGITIREIFQVLLKRWKMLLCVFLIVATIGNVYTFKIKKTTYYSEGLITVEYNGNDTNSNLDITSSLKYVTTVAEYMKKDVVLTQVINDLPEYNLDLKSLNSIISLSYNSNSMLITIKATTEDGEESKKIVKALTEEISKYSYDENNPMTMYCKITVRDNGTNYYKAGPKRGLYLIITILSGLVLGALLSLIVEFSSTKFRNREEIENIGYPIIGVNYKNKKKEKKDSDDLIKPSIHAFEPYNRLLSNIKLSNVDNPHKVVMITSTGPQELKTTVVSNLAYTAYNNNQKVCLIDLDIRKPRVHKVFGLTRNDGIVEYLDGSLTLENVIKHTQKGVDVITAGKTVDNPVVILESEKLKNLINELKEKYDLILVDSSPLLAANDSLVIAKLVDGAVFNVAVNASRKKDVKDSVEQLSHFTNIIGINCTNVPTSKTAGYYYYNYHYGEEK